MQLKIILGCVRYVVRSCKGKEIYYVYTMVCLLEFLQNNKWKILNMNSSETQMHEEHRSLTCVHFTVFSRSDTSWIGQCRLKKKYQTKLEAYQYNFGALGSTPPSWLIQWVKTPVLFFCFAFVFIDIFFCQQK